MFPPRGVFPNLALPRVYPMSSGTPMGEVTEAAHFPARSQPWIPCSSTTASHSHRSQASTQIKPPPARLPSPQATSPASQELSQVKDRTPTEEPVNRLDHRSGFACPIPLFPAPPFPPLCLPSTITAEFLEHATQNVERSLALPNINPSMIAELEFRQPLTLEAAGMKYGCGPVTERLVIGCHP